MQPENPVRQDMQFYYVVSIGELPTVVCKCVQVLMLIQTVRFPTGNFYILKLL